MNDDTQTIDQHARGGIQALDAALVVLRELALMDGPVALTDLARAVAMPASKVHRYLASFIHAGLVTQAGRSGRYELGPFARVMGISAVSRSEFVNDAADGLEELSTDTGLTALLTVWGNQGATVIRWCRAPSPVVTSFGLGSPLPLLSSSSGRVFLAWLPRSLTATRQAIEMQHLRETGTGAPDLPLTEEGVVQLIGSIRERGFAAVDGRFVPGLRAIAAPILNWQGEVEAGVTLISTSDRILEADGPAVSALREFAVRHSSRREWKASVR